MVQFFLFQIPSVVPLSHGTAKCVHVHIYEYLWKVNCTTCSKHYVDKQLQVAKKKTEQTYFLLFFDFVLVFCVLESAVCSSWFGCCIKLRGRGGRDEGEINKPYNMYKWYLSKNKKIVSTKIIITTNKLKRQQQQQ